MATINEILKTTSQKLVKINTKRGLLENRLEMLKSDRDKLSKIKDAVEGLKKTGQESGKEGYDPGKDSTAYYYCSSFDDKNMIESDIPALHVKCPECESKVPVMMSYEQAYDSPELDVWLKTAFSVCICGNYNEIKKISKDHRF